MLLLVICNLILFLAVPFAVFRSGRPGMLVSLYIFLTVAVSVGVFAYSTAGPSDFIDEILETWFTPQQGDPFGTARIFYYLLTVFAVGNLISLAFVFLLAGRMAVRRGARGKSGVPGTPSTTVRTDKF